LHGFEVDHIHIKLNPASIPLVVGPHTQKRVSFARCTEEKPRYLAHIPADIAGWIRLGEKGDGSFELGARLVNKVSAIQV
jgi:hypothetical protein